MKIGLNLLLYTTNPDDSIFPIAEKLKGMGFDGLEWPLFTPDRKMAEKVRKFNEKTGLEATTICVFGEGANPVSDDESERKAALDAIGERLELSEVIGSKLLCGPVVQTLGQFTGKGPTEIEWKRLVDFLRRTGDLAAKRKVTLAVEYLNRFELYMLNTAADASRLCSEVNHPHVKTMVDSFHANIEEHSLYECVLAAKPHLAHIHVSENDRGIPGANLSIPWDDFFRGIKDAGFNGWLTIESFSQFLPDLAAAAKIWRRIFDDPDDVCRDGIAFIRRMMAKHQLA